MLHIFGSLYLVQFVVFLLFFVCVCRPKLEEIGFPLVLRKASQSVRWEDQVQMLVEFRKFFLFGLVCTATLFTAYFSVIHA